LIKNAILNLVISTFFEPYIADTEPEPSLATYMQPLDRSNAASSGFELIVIVPVTLVPSNRDRVPETALTA
jgi:hypothetical protein